MGSPDRSLINADFKNLSEEIRQKILWESDSASEAELAAKEVEFIRK